MARNDPTLTPESTVRNRRVLIAGLAAGFVLLVLVGVGVYGLIARPHDTTPTGPATPDLSSPTTSQPSPRPISPALPTLPETTNSVTYAQAVARVLLGWDTATALRPLDYASVLLGDADPSGEETAGLASDISGYQPTGEAWARLTEYATRQWLVIDDAYVPDAWHDAVAQDTSGRLVDGMVAVTIEGTRHREGVWNDDPVTSEHAVSFTVFLACPPAYDRCHLLRLSGLDNPLR